MVGNHQKIKIIENTNYPFEECIRLSIQTEKATEFPLYLRIPSWTRHASLKINGKSAETPLTAGQYVRIQRTWNDDDSIELTVPMHLSLRTWQVNKNSVSIDYGPLTFSLKIKERYVKRDSRQTAIGDSQWQQGADAGNWPSFEIFPASAWNYALVLNKEDALKDFKIVRKNWPDDNFPFTQESCPIEIKATGRKVPSWKIDEYGLCHELPEANAPKEEKESITLIPMGAARLRISAFPNTYE